MISHIHDSDKQSLHNADTRTTKENNDFPEIEIAIADKNPNDNLKAIENSEKVKTPLQKLSCKSNRKIRGN